MTIRTPIPAQPRASASNHQDSTIRQLIAEMSAGRTTSRQLVEDCLARIEHPGGEGPRTFMKVWKDQARAVADAQDALRRAGYTPSPVAGIPVSIKDLLDVEGEVTRAGSKALDDAPAAQKDAPVVKRLKAAGMVLIGRTNMTQFAASAVGTNPHSGTPGNPWDRARTPGGSSSGAAVCVADGMAVAAIGSDTVGSIRVPAALCGVVGFKPTQARVSREGAVPLSTSLDSIGPLARTVEDCALVDAVIAGEDVTLPATASLRGLRLAVPQGHVLDDLDEHVSRAFERACSALSKAGALLSDHTFDEFAEIRAHNMNAILQFPEVFAWHEKLLARRGKDYDPFVKGRIELGREIAAADYVRITWRRPDLIKAFDRATEPFDAIVMPTVPIVAPTIAECLQEDTDFRSKLIRNPLLFNVLDRCAISLPIQAPGEAPVGLMIAGQRDGDRRLFGIARAVEALFTA